jgi:hypothetical protein
VKVTRRTDTELELRESPALVWLIVGVFGIGGSWVLVHEGELLIAAGFAVVVAVLALVFAVTTTCRFDRAAGELSCARRSFLRTTRVRHPLAEIVGARTERSAARQSQAYRIVLVMSSGTTVPLTTQFTSGRGRHEQVAKAIRDFLSLPEPVDVPIPGFGDLFRMAFDPSDAQGVAGRYADAIALHEEAVRRAPDDVEARRQLATALALSNRTAEARVHLEHARDVARRQGHERIASELDETIRRLDMATAAKR